MKPHHDKPRWDWHVLAVLAVTVLIYAVGACHALSQPDVFAPGHATTVVNQTISNLTVNNISSTTNIVVSTNVYYQQNISVSGKATFNQFLVVSNGIQYASTAWSGPTNTIDLNVGRQHYSTVTPISLTGFINKSTTNTQPVVLKVKNTSGTNITAYLPANFIDLNYGTTYTVTNGIILSLEYDPFLGLTNGVARVW